MGLPFRAARVLHQEPALRSLRPIAACLLLASPCPAAELPQPRGVYIQGRVVAVGGLNLIPVQGDGKRDWSLLVRTEEGLVVQINLGLPEGETPESAGILRRRRFKVDALDIGSQLLERSLPFLDEEGRVLDSPPPLAIWKAVPGAEGVTLPYGRRIPRYSSLEWGRPSIL